MITTIIILVINLSIGLGSFFADAMSLETEKSAHQKWYERINGKLRATFSFNLWYLIAASIWALIYVNSIVLYNVYRLFLWSMKTNNYPYKEGDTYYTIEDNRVVKSYWDDISEEMYDDNPEQEYFDTWEEATEQFNLNIKEK